MTEVTSPLEKPRIIISTRMLSSSSKMLSFPKIFLTSGGSDSVETAAKIARRYWFERFDEVTQAVRRAEDVLARTEDLVEAARNAGRPLSGRFRLGVIPTVAPFLLPAKLPGLRDAYLDPENFADLDGDGAVSLGEIFSAFGTRS